MLIHTLSVALGARSYPIHIGPGLLRQGDCLRSLIAGRQVLVVTNENVAPLYLAPVEDQLHDFDTATLALPDGERFKNLETVNRIFDALLENRFGRQVTVVALGGGVVGDMAGFAAAAYQRGVAYIQLPTTLLAQVDSSVGGKTGVNHRLGKNMIGAFHQPVGVIADTETLRTLPDRELAAGCAEVIKYGLIRDPALFHWLEDNIDRLIGRDDEALAFAIQRSCDNKAAIVAEDEREQGVRALLNLGHTFGHAIETGTGYGSWLHGEAVAVGLGMAAELSARMGWLPPDAVDRTRRLLVRAGLPIHPPAELSAARMRELMAVDKKARDGRLRLVLLRAIGHAVVTDAVDPTALDATLAGEARTHAPS